MKILIFCILSLPLLFFSWRSLFNPKKHGLYRFIVWECILWIAVQNHRYLIVERFDLQQYFSSALMITSLLFVISAVFVMRTKGAANRQRSDDTLLGFEKTTVLITSGIFKHVRHPMYSSLMLLLWGVLFRNVESALVIIALLATLLCLVAAFIEERENLEYFGENYKQYMQRTKMFIPYVI
jgi:protein-S-isoprenylcysteine O-methyltransferase Ste14